MPHFTAEERKAFREQRDLLNAEAAEYFDDPAWRREMAAVISSMIVEGFDHENLLEMFLDSETVGLGDQISVSETRGLRAHWVARGGRIEMSRLTKDATDLPRDTVGFHVYEFLDKVRTNFSDTQSNIIGMGSARLDAAVNQRVLAVFQAAIDAASPYYTTAAGLSLTSLDAALRRVADETTDGGIAIIGRRTMTGLIVDGLSDQGRPSGYIPETNEEMMARGLLGTYKGAQVITIKNFKDEDNTSFFPANEMFVVARDAGKAGFFGELQDMEWVSPDWYWHFQARRDAGFLVHHPERAHRFVDSSQTP